MGPSIPATPHPELTYEVQLSADLLSWTPLARKEGSGSWEVITAGVIVEEGVEVEGRSHLTIVAPAMLPDDSGVQLRLSVNTTK